MLESSAALQAERAAVVEATAKGASLLRVHGKRRDDFVFSLDLLAVQRVISLHSSALLRGIQVMCGIYIAAAAVYSRKERKVVVECQKASSSGGASHTI